MPARRSNYALVSQTDEYLEQDSFNHIQYQHNYNQRLHHQQQPQQQSQPQPQDHSADKWGYVVDTDRQGWERDRGRASCSSGGGGLQRQSSGSSFAESSVSSDYPLPTLTLSPSASDSNIFHDIASNAERCVLAGNSNACSYSSKNWAQQREESYHLQVALALRVSSEAFSTDDPHLLGGPSFELRAASGSGSGSKSSRLNVEAVSHRFWVTGCLSYFDKISDGFYYIWGMNPFVWTMCNDTRESRMPSLESLKSVDASESSFEVILIDKRGDSFLRELENKVLTLAYGTAGTKEKVVEKLGDLVCKHMGGTSSFEDHELIAKWDSTSKHLRSCLNSIVLPIGDLSVGLCRHRALLFKALADAINLPCRIARGCRYCGRDDGSSCMVRYANDREYLVDLIGKPGLMCEPDSFLNGPTSLMVSSPLRLPDLKSSLFNEELCSLVKQYIMDFTSSDIFKNAQTMETPSPLAPANSTSDLQCVVSATNTGPPAESLLSAEPMKSKPFNSQLPGAVNVKFSSSKISEKGLINDSSSLGRISESVGVLSGKTNFELSLAMDGLEIPWSELELKERIGQGSFGTVYHADWQKSDVAVKILSDQDFYEERVKEFLREVAIMKRLRHPNVVLFMGAVLSPNLAIVTEYLPRGSLYRLIHRPGVREHLDERRRLRMALDVAKGMNYLHRHNPPIVHRDLKSPNLLVDKSWTVKVCDFGLSRLKANTFLSSKSAAGTPEWMAPEVLRDEPSNEKSDIYSFGVILWELITLQQPWTGLNPAQVVGAVGFQNRRLHIPRDVSPEIATVIESCWANDPWKRPSFAGVMDSLKPLLKSPISQQSHTGNTSPH